jgi:hypothetical protein
MSFRSKIVAFFSRENAKDTSLPIYFGQKGAARRGWINATHEVEQMKQGKGDIELPPSQWTRPDIDYTTQDRGVTDERGETRSWWRSRFEAIETNTGPEPAPYEPWPGEEGRRPYQPWPGEEDR